MQLLAQILDLMAVGIVDRVPSVVGDYLFWWIR